MNEWKMVIKGKVQGVGFRYAVIDFVYKNHLKITGFVRNLPERDYVEVVADGNEDDLLCLYQFCLRGPTLSRVENVVIEKFQIKESSFNSFKISY